MPEMSRRILQFSVPEYSALPGSSIVDLSPPASARVTRRVVDGWDLVDQEFMMVRRVQQRMREASLRTNQRVKSKRQNAQKTAGVLLDVPLNCLLEGLEDHDYNTQYDAQNLRIQQNRDRVMEAAERRRSMLFEDILNNFERGRTLDESGTQFKPASSTASSTTSLTKRSIIKPWMRTEDLSTDPDNDDMTRQSITKPRMLLEGAPPTNPSRDTDSLFPPPADRPVWNNRGIRKMRARIKNKFFRRRDPVRRRE